MFSTRSLLRVVLAIPTLGERGCGRTLGGIRILVGLFVVSSPNHREVSHLEGVGLLAATLQRTRHTVTHVEVARRHVRRQVQLEIGIARHSLERADNVKRARSRVHHFRLSAVPPGPSNFDDLASTSTPPERRQRPIGTTRASGPALFWKQKHLVRIAVVSEKLLAAFAAVLVVEHLDHFCVIGGGADGERCTVVPETPRRGGRLLLVR